jgi:hypothetical protein
VHNTSVADTKDGTVARERFMLLLVNRHDGVIDMLPLGMRKFPDKAIFVLPENGPKLGVIDFSSGWLWNVKRVPISK